MEFVLRENAGLRRFSYPVRARFSTPQPAAALRLLEAGKPVAAQFTKVGPDSVELDFSASMLPWERRPYRIENGSGPAPRDSMQVDENGSAFLVRHPGGLIFEVPNNLLGFLNTVRTRSLSYMRPGSFGLGLEYRDDIGFRAGGANHWAEPATATVVKRGPLACALRFESHEGLRGSRAVASVVEMEFPRSKSWVEVTWTLEDVENFVSAMWAELDVDLEGEQAVVDYGADTMVYVALRQGQQSGLRGALRRSDSLYDWEVEVAGEPYASGRASRLEGWAHLMDSRRATAAAIADFARSPATADRIDAGAGGKLVLHRRTGGLRKVFRFWLHFVSMPVQVGAATSPQSMQNPLLVDWK